MAKDLPINSRLIVQMARATIKNLLDGLVELITNSDDSYRILESQDKQVNGLIEIYVNRQKGGLCEKLIVKDYARGMSKNDLEQAIEFASDTSGFSSGKTVRGLFGRGLKETIISFGKGQITTIQNGLCSMTSLWSDNQQKAKYNENQLEIVFETDEPNGTEIQIDISNNKIKIPEFNNFVEQFSKHFALRDILCIRNIRLIFEDKKRNTKYDNKISFSQLQGKLLIKDHELKLFGFNDKVKLTIYESYDQLEFERYSPFGLAGILIKTSGAILDNQYNQSIFSNEKASKYFFGEAICEGLEDRLREGEIEIIDQNRGGLRWGHDYCQSLSKAIDTIIEPFILNKRKSLEKTPDKEVKESTNKLLRRLCSSLNEIAKKELDDIDILVPPPVAIKDLIIVPAVANVQIERQRTMTVYAATEIIEKEGHEIRIKSDNPFIHPLSSFKQLERSRNFPDTIWITNFKVEGDKINEIGKIYINLGNIQTFADIRVAPPGKKVKTLKRKGGFISEIKPDEDDYPTQRTSFKDGVISIYIKFPSISRYIKSGFEGAETDVGKLLISELVGEAFCKQLAREKLDKGEMYIPGSELDSFLSLVNELQKKYLQKIQDIIINWQF